MKHMPRGEVRMSQTVFRTLFHKPATIRYLGGALKLDDRCRGLLAYDPTACVACGLCMKDCPTGALHVENRGTKEAKDMHATLDTGRCIFCGQCTDSCAKHCLSVTSESRLARFDRASLKRELTPDADR